MFYKAYGKRVFDLFVASIALIILLPFFLILILLLFFSTGGKPFFVQPRPGYLQRTMYVIKFRTMNEKRDDRGQLLPDDQRLTFVGKFVRKTSLDEIPQLLNVIKGDMSLVGPRPLLVEYLPLYSEQQKKRHTVRPGITGWAQINGRNLITWSQKFEYDLWYTKHFSFAVDLKIIFQTCWKVVKSEGVSARGIATAEKFTGKN